jgi:imidazole glycerol-phosphate synthase subunit HisF
MYRARIIPCLLIRGNGLVKTRGFKDPVYIGDPVNAARIFSDKEVDELIIIDIDASRENKNPNYDLIAEIAGECFMPVTYGGGIKNLQQVRKIIRSGIEKVVVNTATTESIDLIREGADVFGSQAIVGGIDARRSLFGKYKVVVKSNTLTTNLDLVKHARALEESGAGEIFLNSIDRDGKMQGYDLELIKAISANVKIPVVACGGAGRLEHLQEAITLGGASAVAAGSMFVFYGKHRAVLINYPSELKLDI